MNQPVVCDPNLIVVWCGELPAGDWAIVRDTALDRLYAWPSGTAWRQPLPGASKEVIALSEVDNRPSAETVRQGMLF